MSRSPRDSSVARAARAFQTRLRNAGPAMSASYTLMGAILLLGGAGYALDARYDTSPVWAVSGLMLGMIAGFYQLAKALWRR